MNKQINRKKNEAATVEVHWSEWLAGGLSALLIASLLCWLGYHSYQYQPGKADFRVEVTGYTAVENGYRVAFAVFNSSRSSAAQVRVVGTIDEPQGGAEQATAIFDYVASQARSSGALFFSNDPRNEGLKLRVESYIDP